MESGSFADTQGKFSGTSTDIHTLSRLDPNTNYLSEDEARTILKNYQSHLARVKAENKELKKEMEEALEKKIETDHEFAKVHSENLALKKEAVYYQDLANQWDEKLKQKVKELVTEEKSRIESYLTFFDVEAKNHCVKILKNIQEETNHKAQLANLLAAYEDCKKDMNTLLKNYDNILEENEMLRQKADGIIESRESPKICLKCKESFLLSSNNEQACHFHPGSLKYYSCRKCGADEYWSCCNQCRSCLKGCRKGKHVSFQ